MSAAYSTQGEVENKYIILNGEPEEREFLGRPTEGETYYLLLLLI